jgi:DNA-binding response OmpR family regulator
VAFLREAGTCVIFCEHSLPDGSWTRILEVIEDCSAPPLLIVTSRLADDRLWAEVLNLGGFDVLAKPFNEREVRHVLASALTYRANPAPRVQTVGTA